MTASWKNKLVGAVATGAIVAGLFPVSALGAGALTADTTIQVTNVEAGSTVTAYKVVEVDQTNNDTANGTAGWKLVNGWGISALHDIIGKGAEISPEEAATIAAKAKDHSASAITLTGSDTTYSATVSDPGLYLVLVKSNGTKVYNPMFVGADYDQTASSPNTVSAVSKYPSSVVAKSAEPSIEKDYTDKGDETTHGDAAIQSGDTVPFKITVKNVPSYPASYYESPKFEVTDTLDEGLSFPAKTAFVVKAKVGEGNETTLRQDTDYTVTISGQKVVVAFSDDYLKSDRDSTVVTISYDATVGDLTTYKKNVIEKTNEAYITYTYNTGNNPDVETGAKEKESPHEKTHHYSFGLDADLNGMGNGETGGKSKELRKVVVDNNESTEVIYDSWDKSFGQTYTPLAGAKFKLTGKSSDNIDYSQEFTTDAEGRISFYGLDAGVPYTLQEVSAPAGYQVDSTTHTILIDAEYNDDGTLKTYTVKIDNEATSTMTVSNSSSGEIEGFTFTEGTNQTALFKNQKAGILPSTGGTGIIFYLVVGGAVAAISAHFRKQTKQLLDQA